MLVLTNTRGFQILPLLTLVTRAQMLLLPEVERVFSYGGPKCIPVRPQIVKLVSAFVAGYPIYNVIKRGTREGNGARAVSLDTCGS